MKIEHSQFVNVAGKSADKHILWQMQCLCGNSYIAYATRVRSGKNKQCRQCLIKSISDNKKVHGMRGSTEYRSWQAMKARCLNPSNKDYKSYGEKNIFICDSWLNSFESFYQDMGAKPKGYSIDRIDNTKGYYPENCRWASRSQQQQNKRNSCVWVIKDKEFLSLKEAAIFFNVTTTTISKWVYGYHDKRRNKFSEPRHDCTKIFKY
jgi:hypothetical protein